MVLKSSERHIICGTAVTHDSEKVGIVLSLECSVIMRSKNRVNRGRKACCSNSTNLISCLLRKCVCFVKKRAEENQTVCQGTQHLLVL